MILMHAPYILSADDLGDFSGVLQETLHFGGGRCCLGACYRKAMTPKKAMDFTLFPQFVASWALSKEDIRRKMTTIIDMRGNHPQF